MKLGATLYVKDSVGAVAFYMRAFNMTLGYHAKNSDGTFLHAELEKDGEGFAVSESTDENILKAMLSAKTPTMSYGIEFDSEDEVRNAYSHLIDGGHILRPLGALPWSDLSADVVDKYGVCWYITIPQHRPKD